MALRIVTEPTTEPLSLSEVKNWLRLAGVTLADDVTPSQSIVPDAHGIGTIEGTGVDRLGKQTLVHLNSGTYAATATNDAKLQDSDDDITYTDVTSGAFTQVTVANDNAIQEIQYTGTRQYVRVLAVVAVDVADFSATVTVFEPASSEDDLITALIVTAREFAEDYQKRAYITQTWDMFLDRFPRWNRIEIPLPQLQSITAITFFDVDDTEATFSSDKYFVDTQSEPGRVVLNDGETWPQEILRPANGVKIRFIAGYGDAATDVPTQTRTAIKLLIGHLYENREATVVGSTIVEAPFAVKAILDKRRHYDFG